MLEKAILLVDDEAILLLSLKSSLRLRFGSEYRYETALDGEKALLRIDELVREGIEVVIVISDWLMPGMKGDELLMFVHKKHPSTRLVMLTGHADESDIEKLTSEVKLEAFLRKPWNPERLFEVVASALGGVQK